MLQVMRIEEHSKECTKYTRRKDKKKTENKLERNNEATLMSALPF